MDWLCIQFGPIRPYKPTRFLVLIYECIQKDIVPCGFYCLCTDRMLVSPLMCVMCMSQRGCTVRVCVCAHPKLPPFIYCVRVWAFQLINDPPLHPDTGPGLRATYPDWTKWTERGKERVGWREERGTGEWTLIKPQGGVLWTAGQSINRGS